MGFTAKAKNSEGWGMGFLLVFFPEEDHQDTNKKNNSINANLLSSSSPSFKPLSTLLRRTNSAHLLHKAQSTISICALLLFITLLLFTISTLPSTTTAAPRARHNYGFPGRQLSLVMKNPSSASGLLSRNQLSHALQGMGTLYRRGTRAMSDLIVAHAVESLTSHELKLFLRLLYRSSLTSRSDLVFIFRSKSPDFDHTILQENDSFLKLVTQYAKMNRSTHSVASFDVAHFLKMSKKERDSGEPIWGRRIRSNFSEEGKTESTPLSYGSYERLEYVGDSVLNLMVAEEHYPSCPDLQPGDLTRLRAANVDTEKLARAALNQQLHKFLRYNKPILYLLDKF
ncbi:unnamed protein product [Fraxinus pennsylvanica]|uniref:RNase III domain-containing protein n=1 Tax=Fraxinus pennsylvanica TaxID=56036 RepID=A0AAD2ECC3_9LAMI|nr:unnamed protein product [Fraxinus pennsylvanica]